MSKLTTSQDSAREDSGILLVRLSIKPSLSLRLIDKSEELGLPLVDTIRTLLAQSLATPHLKNSSSSSSLEAMLQAEPSPVDNDNEDPLTNPSPEAFVEASEAPRRKRASGARRAPKHKPKA